jgi:glycosyltransferase involved in cell wall biosynthesis
MQKIRKTTVSIIVPAFNEEDIIVRNLTQLQNYLDSIEKEYDWELIIVNDGSTDKTGMLADEFSEGKKNVFVLHHPYNYRLGQALRYGFEQSLGDYVVVMDLDLSYSPEHIQRMLSKIKDTKAKIVVASPYAKGGRVENVPWLRKLLSVWANRFLSFVVSKDSFSDKLTTLTGMVRTYDGDFIRQLNLKAMDVDINPEIIYKAMILRARIVEIPATLKWSDYKAIKSASPKRKSSLRILRSIVQSILSGFIFRPFMFFILPGFVMMLLSLYPISWALIHSFSYYEQFDNGLKSFHYQFSDAVAEAFKLSPHSFIVGGFCLMIAFQLISLGILALQKKRYFEELFHISSMINRTTRNIRE